MICFNDLQLLNDSIPIEVTESRIINCVKEERSSNASTSIKHF